MTETEDPRAALRAGDLPTQASAARDLAVSGTIEDLDALVTLASDHRRTGLRLACAGAAADIVHRAHLGRGTPPLDAAQAQALVERLRRLDPSSNPGLPGILALVPGAGALELLGRLLGDPRNTVRLAALIGLRRRLLTHRPLEPSATIAAIDAWLRSPRLPPDARAELARLVGQADLRELAPTLDDIDGPGEVGRAVTEARRSLLAREQFATFEGLWCSDGLDVLEPGSPAPSGELLIFQETASVDLHPAAPAHIAQGALHVDGPDGPLRLRLIHAPRLGHAEDRPALQVHGRTWIRAEGAEEIATFLREHGPALTAAHLPASLILPAALSAESSAAATRALPAAQLLTDQLDQAIPALERAAAGKRPRAEDLLWLAVARERTGDLPAALAGYRDYLDRSGRKPWGIALAQARLQALSDPPAS